MRQETTGLTEWTRFFPQQPCSAAKPPLTYAHSGRQGARGPGIVRGHANRDAQSRRQGARGEREKGGASRHQGQFGSRRERRGRVYFRVAPEWRNGRRGGLKNRCLTTCEFDSRLGHHPQKKRTPRTAFAGFVFSAGSGYSSGLLPSRRSSSLRHSLPSRRLPLPRAMRQRPSWPWRRP